MAGRICRLAPTLFGRKTLSIKKDPSSGMAEIASLLQTAPRSFMRWWLGELGGLLPNWLTSRQRPVRPALILDLRKDGVELIEATPKSSKTLARLSDQDDKAALSAIGARRYRQWPLILRLEANLGMRKIIDLPSAARDDLASLLEFELDRLTPFSPKDVFFAWRILDRDQGADRIAVKLEIAPKMLVDRAADWAAQHGRSIDRLEIDGDDQEPTLNLFSGQTKEETKGRFKHFLPILALGLAVTAVWIPMSRQQDLVDQLEQELATLKSSADETLLLREKLDLETARAGFLVEAKSNLPAMTLILAELTALIPDHSHILQLEINDDGIRLSGLADKASDLISILDQSEMFASPAFRSAVTRDPRNGKERFQIAVKLTGDAS